MKEAFLMRERGDDQGTFGVLALPDGGPPLYTIELPWRSNRRTVSCIPTGRYRCTFVTSPRFGRVYGVSGVPDRTNILIHGGNFAGDTTKGLKSHSYGCILVGMRRGAIDGQKAVLVSQTALRHLHTRMGGEPFWLNIGDT